MIALAGEMAHDVLALGIYNEGDIKWIKDHFLICQTYYQNTFPFNLENHSSVRSHCLEWGTSDPDNIDLQDSCTDSNKHLDSCKNCDLIREMFMIMMGFCEKVEQAQFRNDLLQIQKWKNRINDAEQSVKEWKNFIIRNKVSEDDWASRLTTERPEKAQATFDFAMDHLPQEPW